MSGLFGALARGLEFGALKRNQGMDTINDPNGVWWSSPSATGININQQTALQVTAVMACVSIVSEDIAKLSPIMQRVLPGGKKIPETKHPLSKLLRRPNSWQTPFEWTQMMMTGLMMRGNAYSVILRNGRGDPVMLVPINPDKVTLWEAPTGDLFFVVTRSGLHELSVLRNVPLFVPYEDVLHWKLLSGNGLLGSSKIALNRDAIGLASALEQMAAYTVGNGAFTRGTLETDKKTSKEVIDRLKVQWAQQNSGIINAGKPLILEDGLKFNPFKLSFTDLEFIASRNFQISEIARMWRIPMSMLGEVVKGGQNHITEQSQEYLNNCLMTYVQVIEERYAFTFGFDMDDELQVRLDLSKVLRGDSAARYATYRIGWQIGLLTDNDMRRAEGLDPFDDPNAEKPFRPVNMVPIDADVGMGMDLPGLGSELSGVGGPGGGKPPDDGTDAAPVD